MTNAGYPCTNRGCKGTMEDRGNYYYCLNCHSLDFKLPEEDHPWRPLPKQSQFLYIPKKYALYVGGVGSGKTMAGSYKSILKSMKHPGGQGLVGAQIYPQLRDATMRTFFEICPEKLMWKGSKDKAFNKSEAILTMSNEFQFLFRPLDDESKLKSLNLVFFWIDEASEVDPSILYQLQARLRSRQGFIEGVPEHEGFVTSNPNGHDWLWQTFVAVSDPDYFWINAPTRENIYLPPNFESDLRKKWPEAWVKRFLDGSFDVFEGQIYPMLEFQLHGRMPNEHFEDHIHTIPEGWPVYVSLDHGVTNPTAVGFYTMTPDEVAIKFDEHYETNKPVSYHAQRIREMLKSWGVQENRVRDWVIDPSTRGQRGMEGRAVMAEYHDQNLYFRPANNQIQAGILQVVEYLMPRSNGKPSFLIHPRCRNTWREMGNYKWKSHRGAPGTNEPETPVDKDDHTCDETRYFLMTMPKITLSKVANPYDLRTKRGQFQLDEKNVPFALRSSKHSNWNKGSWPNW